MTFVDLTRSLSQSASSSETQKGGESLKKELLDADAEQQTSIDADEFSGLSGIVGFTE